MNAALRIAGSTQCAEDVLRGHVSLSASLGDPTFKFLVLRVTLSEGCFDYYLAIDRHTSSGYQIKTGHALRVE